LEAGLQFEHTAVKYLSNTEDQREALAAMKRNVKPYLKANRRSILWIRQY
jgi:hypothetical protein